MAERNASNGLTAMCHIADRCEAISVARIPYLVGIDNGRHNAYVDWRRPLVGILASVAALCEVNTSTSTVSGQLWLSGFMACAAAIAVLAMPPIKKHLSKEVQLRAVWLTAISQDAIRTSF